MAQQANYIVYDLETTGLREGVNGVCEIAMMGIDSVTLEEIDRYESVIAPYKILTYNEEGEEEYIDYRVDQKALEINGLTIAKIEAGKPAKEVVSDIFSFAKSCNSGSKKPILVGHNIIKFDNPHLANFLMSHKKDPAKFFNDNYFIDTQLESHKLFPEATGKGEHTLARLCERFGVDKFDAHSAMPDVVANADVFVRIMKKLRGEGVVVAEKKERIREKFKFG